MTFSPISNTYAIRAAGLAKRYVIGTEGQANSLRDALSKRMSAPLRAMAGRKDPPPRQEAFWALKDVSFNIKRGEIVGIIGRNGAGKSTLLKIMSRITEPTKGRVEVVGRVSSLLEVGTGFHPELTGRENVFLNGAILGMTRAEVRKKFDEMVSFAGVERFIDMPVKHYSSGMYMRLAFAVAAHLETEILLIDEVLAVGDVAFQQKCLAKMEDIAGHGRTVLFVSHNMTAVQSLCNRVIHLANGQVIGDGEPKEQINNYLSAASVVQKNPERMTIGDSLSVVDLLVSPNPVESGTDVHLSFNLLAHGQVKVVDACFLLYALEGARLGIVDLRTVGVPISMNEGDGLHIESILKSIPLVDRQYRIALYIDAATFAAEIDVAQLTVSPGQRLSSYATHQPQARGWIEFKSECTASKYKGMYRVDNRLTVRG
jgi:lipopolysaccharide transport system ATP-binding protein